MSYRLAPVWEVSTFIWNDDRNTTLTKIGKEIYKVINEQFGLLDGNCKSCVQNVWVSHKLKYFENVNQDFPEYFIFSANFAADKYCQEEFLIQRLLVLRGTNLIVKLHNRQMITFSVHIETRSVYMLSRLTYNIFLDFQQCDGSLINLSRANLCPTITLTSDDYLALINVTTTASQRANVNALFGRTGAVTPNSLVDLDKKTYACLENYKNVFAAINGAPVPQLLTMLWVTCVLICKTEQLRDYLA